jgi:hypothetical protein
MQVQQWIAVVGTALGAIIGLSSAFINERVRWKREQLRDRLVIRRDLYAQYIASCTEIHEAMRAVSRNENVTAADRFRAVHDAYRAGHPYNFRYQIGVIADQSVLDAAEAAFQKLRDIRDLLAEGSRIEDEKYQSMRRQWGLLVRDMQRKMRDELGSTTVELKGGS